MTATPQSVDVAKVREWLADGGEIAFVDVREEGQHGEGHPLLAVNLPYSRLEIDIGRIGAAALLPDRPRRRWRRRLGKGGAPPRRPRL